jgi:hypothetical protein
MLKGQPLFLRPATCSVVVIAATVVAGIVHMKRRKQPRARGNYFVNLHPYELSLTRQSNQS